MKKTNFLKYSKSKSIFIYEVDLASIKKVIRKKLKSLLILYGISFLLLCIVSMDFKGSLMSILFILGILTLVLTVFMLSRKFPSSVVIKNRLFHYKTIKLNGKTFEKTIPLDSISSQLENIVPSFGYGYNLQIRYPNGRINISENTPGWNLYILTQLHEVIEQKYKASNETLE